MGLSVVLSSASTSTVVSCGVICFSATSQRGRYASREKVSILIFSSCLIVGLFGAKGRRSRQVESLWLILLPEDDGT
jgi:hypothetical protein